MQGCDDRVYTDNGPDSNLLRPGTAFRLLHGQHAPGLAQVRRVSVDGESRRRIGRLAYAPCTVNATAGGKPVQLDVQTDYPFNDTINAP